MLRNCYGIMSQRPTGLAQKGGPVVSHLRISTAKQDVSNSISAGQADTYLGFETLAATQPSNLIKANPERTISVVSTSKLPTGQMIVDNTLQFPDVAGKVAEIERVSAGGKAFSLDAEAMAEAFFGEYLAANNIILGAAYQLGAIPISLPPIERAVQLNGVAVEMNLAAFRWGRLSVIDPGLVKSETEKAKGGGRQPEPLSPETQQLVDSAGVPDTIRPLLERRVPELVDYQNVEYAQQYVEFVRKIGQIEAVKAPGKAKVTEAVSRYLFKLMAYKDEYEVARLLLDPAFQADLKQKFGEKAKIPYHLDQPSKRQRGYQGKMELGSWFTPGLTTLRSMKRLRGTPLDPFGRSEVKKAERALIQDYRQMVESAMAKLTEQNYDTVVAIAQLPDRVRGYEQIRLATIEQYREAAKQLVAQL